MWGERRLQVGCYLIAAGLAGVFVMLPVMTNSDPAVHGLSRGLDIGALLASTAIAIGGLVAALSFGTVSSVDQRSPRTPIGAQTRADQRPYDVGHSEPRGPTAEPIFLDRARTHRADRAWILKAVLAIQANRVR